MKKLILCLLFFVAGFLTHAFFFPEILNNGLTDVSNYIVPSPVSKNVSGQSTDPQLTNITFDGKHFSRHAITVGFTRYVQIVNESEKDLMWLNSTIPELATDRGYGYTEAVKTQCNKKGSFVVVDKNNTEEKLVITVK